jgi:hypothetical protein
MNNAGLSKGFDHPAANNRWKYIVYSMPAMNNPTPTAKYPTTTIGTAILLLIPSENIVINPASVPAVASPTGAINNTGVITLST